MDCKMCWGCLDLWEVCCDFGICGKAFKEEFPDGGLYNADKVFDWIANNLRDEQEDVCDREVISANVEDEERRLAQRD